MMRRMAFLAVLALVVGPAYVTVSAVTAKTLLAQATAPAAPKTDSSSGTDGTKKPGNVSVDWGDVSKAKPDVTKNPDAAEPTSKVNLATTPTLTPAQIKAIENIKKKAADPTDKLAQKAQDAFDGKDKQLKKPDSIALFRNAGQQYFGYMNEIENLAKAVKDRDTKLTLLRELGDLYKGKSCEMYCKEARARIDLAKTPNDLKSAIEVLAVVRKMDPNYAGLTEVVTAGNDAAAKMAQPTAQKGTGTSSGGNPNDPLIQKQYDPSTTIKPSTSPFHH